MGHGLHCLIEKQNVQKNVQKLSKKYTVRPEGVGAIAPRTP